jgi:dolichyl-phosphate beta-glucosyltransferase
VADCELSVVIPAFNEAGRIEETLASLCDALPGMASTWEIRLVDDGSTDDTVRRVEAVAARKPRVVVQREPHRGKGGAVRAGMLAAAGRLRFMCDADLSMPAAELARFMALVPARCDVAIASRELSGARRIGEPPHRHLMGRAFNALVRWLAVPGIADTQCGFKMFSREAALSIFPRVTTDGWAFDIEALVIARESGLRVIEVPVEWHYREQSRVSVLADPVRMTGELWRIHRRARAGLYRPRS